MPPELPVETGHYDLKTASSSELVERFLEVRRQTERLAAPLSPEDQTVQSMPDCSPTKWHRAHITWFFETFILATHLDDFRPFHPDYGYLFNSYYEAVGARHPRPNRGMITRPSVDEVTAYRQAIDEAMVDLINRSSDAQLPHLAELVELGIHHERQHQELLLMDIKHLLSRNPMQPAYQDLSSLRSADVGDLGWIEFEATTTRVGREPADQRFAFDNEFPAHDELIGGFLLADRLVTAGEWLEFMADDGYHRPELWLSDGWYKRQQEGWESPEYWSPTERGWEVYTLTGARTVDRNEPVCHLSFYEADAYARWAGLASRPKPNGNTLPAAVGSRACSPVPRPTTRRRLRRPTVTFVSSSATAGSGRAAPIAPTPAIRPRTARSVSTTASS
jgi:ergothioneine biosynthesis protein EgtB